MNDGRTIRGGSGRPLETEEGPPESPDGACVVARPGRP